MYDPHEPHLTAAKRILRYLQGTLNLGLLLRHASTSDLIIYTVADWAGYSWATTASPGPPSVRTPSPVRVLRQITTSWPMVWQRACWLRQLLVELHSPLSWATLVYCDNVSAVYLSTNPVQHQRTKHVEIDLHFVRERVAIRYVRVLHILMTSQFTDIFTKGLPSSVFSEFRSSLNICSG
jgi:hypothetical protein